MSKDSHIDCNDDSDIDLGKIEKAQTKMLGVKARTNQLGGQNVYETLMLSILICFFWYHFQASK